MSKFGMSIDYAFCVDCHACEIACIQEHDRPAGQCGIQIQRIEPEVTRGKLYYYPFMTDHCDFCGKRISRGLQPACVHNCYAGVMRFGPIQELCDQMRQKSKMVLWTPH